jgi:23S rRNA (adenine2503-C2)-methyltransferase
MQQLDLKNLSPEKLNDFLILIGEKPFRAKQISKWIFEKQVSDINDMTDLSISLREKLKERSYISLLEKAGEAISSDGTTKYLFKLSDGLSVESVLIPDKDRNTLCISTQVGCKMKCKFCLTGSEGFMRNLNHAEILDQIICVNRNMGQEKKITNIVLMGMGEPLDNYENTVSAIKTMISSQGMNLAPGRITISTSGIIPKLENFIKENLKVKLAVSLNGASNEIRSKIMPINKKYPIESLLKTCISFSKATGKYVMFEYVLLKGVNDSIEDAKSLAKLLKGMRCKINLIPFNSFQPGLFATPDESTVEKFHSYLIEKNFIALTRKSKGVDILAACGQLRWSQEISGKIGG